MALAAAQDPDVRPPQPVYELQPDYPASEMRGNPGPVVCRAQVQVDRFGVPSAVDVRSCPDAFVEAARSALFQWRFTPAARDGQPVSASFDARLTFRIPDQFLDTFLGLGVVHTPEVLPGGPARTSGVVRLYASNGSTGRGRTPKWVTWGANVDLRGFRRVMASGSLVVGASLAKLSGFRAAFVGGIGYDASGLRQRDFVAVWLVPVKVSTGLVLGNSVGLVARGGVGIPFAGIRTERPGLVPEAVVGMTFGQRVGPGVGGFRIEGGYRQEFGLPVWSVVAGLGI